MGRAIQPTPASCDGATVSGTTVTPDVACTYPAGSFGELDANVTGLLATQENNTVPFSLEADTAPEFYVTGNPGPDAAPVRSLEHGVAAITAANPYTGTTQKIDNYIADPAEEAILHMVNADPARTPTFAMFAKPDYYLRTTARPRAAAPASSRRRGTPGTTATTRPRSTPTTWASSGPGVRHLGLDGPTASQGPSSAGPDSGQITVSQQDFPGPWVDETDIRPTLMYLTGLRDDYEHDGRVITQVLARPNRALSDPAVTTLGECYKQLNSSVGEFGAATLQASTNAVDSTSAGDATYIHTNQALTALDKVRDALAGKIKGELEAAAFSDTPVPRRVRPGGCLPGRHRGRQARGGSQLT